MKKFLVLVLALIMCLGCFASCTIEPQNPDNTPGGDDKTPTLEEATDYLYSIYKNDAKEHTGDYELIGKVKIGSTEFPVTWTVDTDLITIKASTKTNGFWTVDLPAKNDTAVNYKLTATIKDAAGKTATKTFDRTIGVYDNSTVVSEPMENVAYKFFLNQGNLRKTLYATAETQDSKYIKGTTDPTKGLDFYAEKVDGGYKFYTTINDAKMYLHAHTEEKDDGKPSKYLSYAAESDNVWSYKAETNAWYVTINNLEYVVGTYNTFDTFCISDSSFMKPSTTGVSQFPGNFITKENAENQGVIDNSGNFDDGQVVTLEKFLEAADACADKGAPSKEKYIIEGVIVEIENTQYGNLYIENEAGTKVYVYGLNDADGKSYSNMDYKPQVGDTVKLYGSAGKYNKTQMPNATLISVTKGEGNQGTEPTPPATGTLNAVTAPVEGTAYKLFLVQVTNGKTLFATKNLQDNKYIIGSETATEGVDFYAEAVSGGYKFYTTIDGAKVYLHAHTEPKDGGKFSKFLSYEAESDNVWYYKAETNAWYVTIGGLEYVLGTYSSFNTFCISDSSFMTSESTGVSQFPGTFATKENAESLGGSTGGDDNQGGTEPTPPATGTLNAVTAPVAGTTYKLFLNQVTTGKLLYATAELSNNQFIVGTETAADGLDFYAEVVTGGYKFYTTIDGAKMYLHAHTVVNGTKTNKYIGYAAESDNVWVYEAETNAWFVTIDGAKYVLGTYNSFNTFSISEAKFITAENTGVTQFPGAFATKEEAESLGGSTGGDQGGTEPTPPVSGGNVCDFAGLTVSTSYAAEQTTTSGWVANYASYQNPQVLGFNVLVLNGKTATVGKLTSPTLNGGISALSFNYTNVFNENNGVDITINIYQNGQIVATTTLDDDSVERGVAETFTWTLDTAIEGEFVIEIVNNSPTQNASQNKDRVALWDIAWVSTED